RSRRRPVSAPRRRAARSVAHLARVARRVPVVPVVRRAAASATEAVAAVVGSAPGHRPPARPAAVAVVPAVAAVPVVAAWGVAATGPDGAIGVSAGVTIQEYAPKLNRTPADLVKILFEAGEMVTATMSLADEMIELIAETLGATVLLVEPGSEQEVEFLAMLADDDEDAELLEPRAPVGTVRGR